MYTPRGAGISELGDIEVVADGDDLHLFHLTLPNHDVVQHAVSRDGLTWRPLPAALRTGDPGACDDDQIWTMSVTPRPAPERGYVMLYTALGCADDGTVQRIAAATSDDLIHWTKSPHNPAAADPRWYEADPAATGSVSFRDPKPVRTADGYLATVCAREREGPLPRRGCVALLRSHDLERWEALPPLFAPRRYWDLECPQLFRLGGEGEAGSGAWYLTAAIMEDRSQRYWVASEAAGPFATPPGGDLLAPAGHYAARIARWREMDLFFAWHQPALAAGWQTTPRTVDWVSARNPFGKFLAPPLLLSARPDDSLALGSFPGWEAFRGDWGIPQPAARTAMRGEAVDRANGLGLSRSGGMDLLLDEFPPGDVLIEGALSLGGARGGIALRAHEDGSGLYVELVPGSRRVTLQRWGIRRDERGRPAAPAYGILQEAERREPLPEQGEMALRVLSVGPYVEVSLDGEVAIAFMSGTPKAGHWGVWAEDGACVLREARLARMRRPGEDAVTGD